MLTPRIRAALAVLAASAAAGACTNLGPYGGIGVGVGSGYGGYGGYGYDPYYAGYGYGSGYGYNPYGWYNGYYYPGSGYWVYDPDRNRRPLTEAEKAYWNERLREYMRKKHGIGGTSTAAAKENWSGFSRPSSTTATGTVDGSSARSALRQRALEQRAQRQQVRSERQESIRQQIQERRESRRASKPTDE